MNTFYKKTQAPIGKKTASITKKAVPIVKKQTKQTNTTQHEKNTNTNAIKTDTNVFFKLAPVLDPIKYLIGKYNINDEKLFTLPKINSTFAISSSRTKTWRRSPS